MNSPPLPSSAGSEDEDDTWVGQVLRDDRLLGPDDATRLQAIADREFGGRHPGRRYSESERPNEFDLVPDVLRSKGGGTVGRFLQLEVADPIRTEVLCYLVTRDTLTRLRQHNAAELMERITQPPRGITSPREYGQAMQVDDVHEALQRTTAEKEYACLVSRHSTRRAEVECLIAGIQHAEVVAFRRALRIGSFEYPNRS